MQDHVMINSALVTISFCKPIELHFKGYDIISLFC